MNIQLDKPLYQANIADCDICKEHTAWMVNGTIQQPCPSCSKKIANEDIRQQVLKSRIADYKSIMDKKYIDADWKIFNKGVREQIHCARSCKTWSESFQVGNWLLMRGNQGTGKTLIKNLIIKDFGISRKCTMKATTGITIYNKYLDVIRGNDSLSELVSYYASVDLLIIDELGKHGIADGFKNFLNDVIDNFYVNNKSLIVISNSPLKRINEDSYKYVSDFIDVDRINEKALQVEFNYESYRGK